MKKTVLQASEKDFSTKLNRQIALAAFLGIAAAVLSVSFLVLRNESNHGLMYWLTVITDVLYGWFLIAFLNLEILPKKRLLALTRTNKAYFYGKIVDIEDKNTIMRKIECRKIIIEGEETRAFFLPYTLELTKGESFKVGAVSSIIVEVSDE